ncbi:MAG: hypothetical protein FWE67_01785 [Planctomycetaceae bacterium]|nr:hypothetical protein [Planctomycetaceae bacterium]
MKKILIPIALLLLICLIALTVFRKNEKKDEAQNNPSEMQGAVLPLPSKETLDALGPENTLDMRFVLPDTLFIIIGQPKKFFDSSIGKGNEGFFSGIISERMGIPYNIAKAESFIVSFAPAILNVETENNGVRSVQPRLIFRRTITFQLLDEAVPEDYLKPLLTENVTVDSLKKKIGDVEYYDLTDPNNKGLSQVALHLPDPKTMVLIEGFEQDLASVLTPKPDTPPNAVVLRAKRLDLQKTDIAFAASLEGMPFDSRLLTQLLGVLQEIPQGWTAPLAENLRAVQITAAADIEVGKPMLNALYDAIDAKGAAEVAELIQGVIINAQTLYASLDEQGKKALTLPHEYITAALNGMEIRAEGTQARFTIENFENFQKTLASGIQHTKMTMLQAQLAQAKHDQLVMLARCFAVYENRFKKYPSDIRSADGKPLLSWRVPLLQIMTGFEELYDEFKLDEPWDSPANKPLLEKMPPIFRQLGVQTDEESQKTKTIVRLFNAPDDLPLANPNLKFSDIKNPQGTLLLASMPVNLAAEWTKPEDLVWDVSKAEEFFGKAIFAVSFNGAVDAVPLIPLDENAAEEQKKAAEDQRKFIDAFIRGKLN